MERNLKFMEKFSVKVVIKIAKILKIKFDFINFYLYIKTKAEMH